MKRRVRQREPSIQKRTPRGQTHVTRAMGGSIAAASSGASAMIEVLMPIQAATMPIAAVGRCYPYRPPQMSPLHPPDRQSTRLDCPLWGLWCIQRQGQTSTEEREENTRHDRQETYLPIARTG